jgi:hypothetical protein
MAGCGCNNQNGGYNNKCSCKKCSRGLKQKGGEFDLMKRILAGMNDIPKLTGSYMPKSRKSRKNHKNRKTRKYRR